MEGTSGNRPREVGFERRWRRGVLIWVMMALLASVLTVTIAPAPAAAADAGFRLPFAGTWQTGQRAPACHGLYGESQCTSSTGYGFDFFPVGTASRQLLAVATGTVSVRCSAGARTNNLRLTADTGHVFDYIHVDRNTVVTGRVTQGAVIGSILPAGDNSSDSCGQWQGAHVHFQVPSLPFTLDGQTLTNTTGAYVSFTGSSASADPIGSFDSIDSPGPGLVHVSGWTFDPDGPTTPITVHVYVGGPAGSGAPGFDIGATNVSRPDVQQAYPQAGSTTGFDATVSIPSGGGQDVYIYAINIGAGNNRLIGSRHVTLADPTPVGNFDSVSSPTGGALHVRGWTFDPNGPTTPIGVHIYVGGPAGSGNARFFADIGVTNAARLDVKNAFPQAGTNTGFETVLHNIAAGTYPVYAYAINIGPGNNKLLGSGSVTVAADTAPPAVTLKSPVAAFTLGTTQQVTWAGTDAGAGIRHYQARYVKAAYNGGFSAWQYPSTWQALTSGGVNMSGLAPGYTYCFSVRAIDRQNNASAWTASRCVARVLDDRSLTASSGWTRPASDSRFFLNTSTYTSASGRTLSRSAQVKRVALLVTKCADCGTVGVYLNGTLYRTVGLGAQFTQRKVLIPLPLFTLRTTTVTLRSQTSGDLVQIDGLGLSRV